MTQNELLDRITVNPAIFGGKPIIRGMRIAVEHVLGMLAAGETPERLLQEYPFLETADIQACLAYAHRSTPGDQAKDWRSTIGMFQGDPVILEIQEEGRKVREAGRRAAKQDSES